MIALERDELEGLPRRRLKRSEYDQLVTLGAFEDERVELLFGEMVPMERQSVPHSRTTRHVHRELLLGLGRRAGVQSHSPIEAAAESEPEPDVAVFPLEEDERDGHPRACLLVIEVSDSSRAKDLGPKARLYALSGIPAYWAVDIPGRRIWVHTDPADGAYQSVAEVLPGAGATLAVPGFPDVVIAVDDIFAKA